MSSDGASAVAVTRIYADAAGDSHFSDHRVALRDGGAIGALSEMFPASGVMLRVTPGSYDFPAHCAPRRQWIVSLDAGLRVTVSDGEERTFAPGALIFVEDVTGKGHYSRAVDGRARTSVFIEVPDDWQLPGLLSRDEAAAAAAAAPSSS